MKQENDGMFRLVACWRHDGTFKSSSARHRRSASASTASGLGASAI